MEQSLWRTDSARRTEQSRAPHPAQRQQKTQQPTNTHNQNDAETSERTAHSRSLCPSVRQSLTQRGLRPSKFSPPLPFSSLSPPFVRLSRARTSLCVRRHE